jgi:hypothetical protein
VRQGFLLLHARLNWHTQSYSLPPSAWATSGCLIMPMLSESQLCVCVGGDNTWVTLALHRSTGLSLVGLAPEAGTQVGLDRPAHPLQHNQVCPCCSLRQLNADLQAGISSRAWKLQSYPWHGSYREAPLSCAWRKVGRHPDPLNRRLHGGVLTLDRSITGSPEPLATTCSCRVEMPLHSTGSAAQICGE